MDDRKPSKESEQEYLNAYLSGSGDLMKHEFKARLAHGQNKGPNDTRKANNDAASILEAMKRRMTGVHKT